MKDRATRRHQEFKSKRKITRHYNSCIKEMSQEKRRGMEGNIAKIRKVCATPYSEEHDRKLGKKTIQERKHDITMREQIQ